ncbi:hypothetical protein B0H11DRAFT_2096037 [Mycena galericulata]|nr:hypothetical protein B0H11DRAFT_2096037 [Mycena galericulata]
MPRVKTAATSSIHRSTSTKATSQGSKSISAPIAKRPTRLTATKDVPSPSTLHPDELDFIHAQNGGTKWSDLRIIRFLTANTFSVPPRTSTPWVYIHCADGTQVRLPREYRLPLLWVAKFMWTSVKLSLTAHPAIRQNDWDTHKFEYLHIARLCARLLASARAQIEEIGAMLRSWRCALFDRPLRRYYHECPHRNGAELEEYYNKCQEAEDDVLSLGWERWVLTGFWGFLLTEQEIEDGIAADTFMRGLVVDEDVGTLVWKESLEKEQETPSRIRDDVSDVQVKADALTYVEVTPDIPPRTPSAAYYSPPGNDIQEVVSHTEARTGGENSKHMFFNFPSSDNDEETQYEDRRRLEANDIESQDEDDIVAVPFESQDGAVIVETFLERDDLELAENDQLPRTDQMNALAAEEEEVVTRSGSPVPSVLLASSTQFTAEFSSDTAPRFGALVMNVYNDGPGDFQPHSALREEMHVLRANVEHLRGVLIELKQEVERMKEREAIALQNRGSRTQRVHPLQHLLAGKDGD